MTRSLPVKASLVVFTLLFARTISVCGQTTHAFTFRDTGDETGLFPGAAGVQGHAAAWGDVDGGGYPSLFIGTFHYADSKPSILLRSTKGHFVADDKEQLHLSSCASGAIFVDLTNNGHLDLFVSNNAHGKTAGDPRSVTNTLYRNDSKGNFTDISKDSGACPPDLLGRTVAALDYDGDGLLDLVVTDFYYSAKSAKGIALFHNKGNYHFEDVTQAAGLPLGASISGVAVADINGDGWPDLFLVSADGNNRFYLNNGHGKYVESAESKPVFSWGKLPPDNMPTGVCIADINGDGLPDVVVGHHYKEPWYKPASVRLYLNKGMKNGSPTFEDITVASGLKPEKIKAPHVEFQDYDNDGKLDIFVSIIKFNDNKPYPLIYKNMGVKDGIPRFQEDAWEVNDWPSAKDLEGHVRVTPLFEKIRAAKTVMYTAAAPTADYDRDGKLDIFMANWFVDSRSYLLHNETPGGNWLEVQVQGSGKVNRMGIGSVVNLYRPGKIGDKSALLGSREVAIGYGWCSGQEAVVHFGLGKEEQVDMEVILPHGNGKVVKKGVKAGQRLLVTQ